jgi:hypothetical protein
LLRPGDSCPGSGACPTWWRRRDVASRRPASALISHRETLPPLAFFVAPRATAAGPERSKSGETIADVPQKPSRGHCGERSPFIASATIWRTTGQPRAKESLDRTPPRLEFIQRSFTVDSSTAQYVHRKYVLDKHDWLARALLYSEEFAADELL